MGGLPGREQEVVRGHRHRQVPVGDGEAPVGGRCTGIRVISLDLALKLFTLLVICNFSSTLSNSAFEKALKFLLIGGLSLIIFNLIINQ